MRDKSDLNEQIYVLYCSIAKDLEDYNLCEKANISMPKMFHQSVMRKSTT